MTVVSNTSPLNYLVQIGCVDALQSLFGQVVIPFAVQKELQHQRAPQPVRVWVANLPDWLSVQEPTSVAGALNLGAGEAAALALAEETGARWLLIDDRAGSKEASRRGLAFLGTLAVLDQAAALEIIDLPDAIQKLRTTSFYLSEALLDELLARDVARKQAKASGGS